jgi:hypothetical protein
MNPFPDTILVPTTANRLRITPNNEKFIERLLELEVDAASFLMPWEDMPDSNDSKVAVDDLMAQIPAPVMEKIFPKPTPLPEVVHLPKVPVTATEDDDGGGMGMSMLPGQSRDERERLRRRESDGYGMSM